MKPDDGTVVALCGGVGGAKLADGLYDVLPPDSLCVVVNTGDDFRLLGLHVSPDVDTVIYTLAGLADRERGWGRAGETWQFMASLSALGGEDWFSLGDRDLAMHVLRSEFLRSGGTLSDFCARVVERLDIRARILPMSDDPVRTLVETAEERLPFQTYFVKRRCEPVVSRVVFSGAAESAMAEGVLAAITNPKAQAVVICPSNPFLSIDPILAVPGMREALRTATAPVVAVSPIIAGEAVKGPTAKIMDELGIPRTSAAIHQHYAGLIDALIIDETDELDDDAIVVEAAPILMSNQADRRALAQKVLTLAAGLKGNFRGRKYGF